MKSFVILLIAVLFVVSCEKEKDDDQPLNISGKLVSHSSCKNYSMSFRVIPYPVNTPDSLTVVEYNFDKANNILKLKHINAGFNCCSDSIYCSVSYINDTIIVKELESGPKCNCDCLYDLNIEINSIVAQKYHVKFEEPYAANQDLINFEIDLNSITTGDHSVIRKTYPWGLNLY